MIPETEELRPSKPRANQNLSRWFWGTIIILAALSILFTLLAKLRHHDDPSTEGGGGREQVTKSGANELSGTLFGRILNKSNEAGLDIAKKQIGSLLDAAYAPVYDAIPLYTDFHYSLPGEYLELTQAAIGDLGQEIQERLFAGHQQRLNQVMNLLDESFEKAYRKRLEISLGEALPAASNGAVLGSLSQTAIEGAKTRIKVTAPVAGLVIVGSAASLKAASALIAKKIGAKIAVKAAAKSGAKWAAAGSGAASGAIVCSWAGPGAGICAAGGAVIAWVAVDIAVLNLDELMNREEFEENLKSLIDEDKSARRRWIEIALDEKFNQVQVDTRRQVADFTLKQLTGPKATALCAIAASFISEYSGFRKNLSKRRPASVGEFRSKLAQSSRDPVLVPLVDEIEQNLDRFGSRLTITWIEIRGNVQPAFRENRDISARITLRKKSIDFDRTEASKDSEFVLRKSPDTSIMANSVVRIQLAIEQHRRVFPNRHFGGAVDLDIFSAMTSPSGLTGNADLMIPIVIDYDQESVEVVDGYAAGEHPVSIELSFTSEPLPELEDVPKCSQSRLPASG